MRNYGFTVVKQATFLGKKTLKLKIEAVIEKVKKSVFAK